jgi:adenylate kinase family enzyme
MKRVLIIGSSGSGKSTLAKRLGELTGLEVIHLDKLHWQPNWVEPSKADWQMTVEKALAGDSWIIDGNFSGTMEMRLEACDTAIFLDVPRWVCVFRILKRLAFYKKQVRPDMAEGCTEQFDWKFVKWVWAYPERSKPKVERLLNSCDETVEIIRLRSNADVEGFLTEHK